MVMSNSSLVRRHYLSDPGEPLTLVVDPLANVDRFSQMLEDWGLPAGSVAMSPLVSIPVPIYDPGWGAQGVRRWPGTKPEAMWHPLMWLPDELAFQFEMFEESDPESSTAEGFELWSLRLACELESSGLYSPALGWVDVLAAHGLDSARQDHLARVERWLHGAPDQVLDQIDLRTLMGEGWSPQRCLELASESAVALSMANRALAARCLLDASRHIRLEPGADQAWPTITAAANLHLPTRDWDQLADPDHLISALEVEWDEYEPVLAALEQQAA